MWRIAIAFLLGHCCVHSLPVLPPLRSWTVVAAIVALLATSRWASIAAFTAGVCWAWFNAAGRIETDLPQHVEGADVLIRGYVASLPDGATDPQFVFDVYEARAGIPPRVRLTWYRVSSSPQPGEPWQLRVRLKRRNGLANPGGFDFEAHLFRDGIGATGYVRDDPGNRRLGAPSIRYAVLRVRAWIASRIAAAAHDPTLLGVVQGLAVGDTRQMSTEQWRVFAATGTTHLMAISGLHIGMIAALAAWLGGNIVRLRNAQGRGWAAMHGHALAGAGAALGYSLLAGMSIPTQRTLVMLCIFFATRWRRRELAIGHVLSLALIVILLIDPFAPLAAGAWLSFGAVAVILLSVAGRLQPEGLVRDFGRVQLAVTLGLIPVLIAAFGSVSLISPIVNLAAVPLFTLVLVPAVLIGTLASIIYLPAGSVLLVIPTSVLNAVWPVLERLADLPLAVWYFPQPSPLAFAALLVGVLFLLLPGIAPVRFAGALLCLPAMLNRPPAPAAGDFDLTLLDVGQGLAVVVRTRSHVLLYDTGPAFQSGRNAADGVVLPYLRHLGLGRIDTLMVSHGDIDHAGGLETLVAALPISRVVLGPSVRPSPGRAELCRRGQRWTWDGVEFEILHPEPEHYAPMAYSKDNDSSCVLRIQSPAGRALLTGDIEAQGEGQLLQYAPGPVDLVVVPHHGSRTSSSPALVETLIPQVALVSAGYRNRWNLPQADVVERWRAHAARDLSTAQSGAIQVSFVSGEPLRVQEYRRDQRRYWHR